MSIRNQRLAWGALLLAAAACGGNTLGDGESCPNETTCSPGESWSNETCACELDDAGPGGHIDDASVDAQHPPPPNDAAPPPFFPDSGPINIVDSGPIYILDSGPINIVDSGPIYIPDSGPIYDPDSGPIYTPDGGEDANICPDYDCPSGYVQLPWPNCYCEQCPNTCAPGLQPGASCNECNVACAVTCPSGFEYGEGCSCIPVDAGIDAATPPDDAGIACWLGFSPYDYTPCPANSWCPSNVCPDGVTQTGCYCLADGGTDCQLSCPPPPPCAMPNGGTCGVGETCYTTTCENATQETYVCECYESSQAYCYEESCEYILDAGVSDAEILPP